jgi:uncharacterized protein YbjT (DUF2867 family)
MMFAITGITGKVGGKTARRLLDAQQPVRAIVRNPNKGASWAGRGCEIAVADMGDAESLTSAFRGADGVFVLLPPNFDPTPGFPEVRARISALKSALLQAKPGRVVVLSTIGAQAAQINLLTQLGIMEQELATLPMPIAFLRAAWFMENSSLDVTSARNLGTIDSFLQPLEKPVPMVATEDIGRIAAELLQKVWTGRRVVELEGPHRITPTELGATFAKVLGHPVNVKAIPRSSWEEFFHSQGMTNPEPRMQMLDGFNDGWIEFESGEAGSLKGVIDLETVLRSLVQEQRKSELSPSQTSDYELW